MKKMYFTIFVILLLVCIAESKNKKMWTPPGPLPDEYNLCDSLSNPSDRVKEDLTMWDMKLYKFFNLPNEKLSISELIEYINLPVVTYNFNVTEDEFIEGARFDFFTNDKYLYRIEICFDKSSKIMSCCGFGGEFVANNSAHWDAREKNFELIKNVTNYTVFQFKTQLPKKLWFIEDRLKLKQLLQEYKQSKKKRKK